LQEEKQQKKIVEKLALQCEKEHLAKDAEDNKRKIALLLQLFQSKLGNDIDALLASNLQVPLPIPFLSTPTPLLPGILFVVFLPAKGPFGLQSSPFISEESIFWPSIPESLSYPQSEDNSY
jgi:hypothetical protein